MDERLKALIAYGMTEEEALETLADDDEVDHMTKASDINSDLTEEQKKVVKKAKNVGTRKTEYQFTKRERKPDELKRTLIADLAEWCKAQGYNDVEISNAEKVVDFKIGNDSYSLSLTRHRPPKK